MRVGLLFMGILLCGGCNLSRNLAGTDGAPEVTGHFVIPDGYTGSPDDFCQAIRIVATEARSGAYLGKTSMFATSNACSFTTSNLPSDVDLSVNVSRESPLPCSGAEAATVGPASVPLRLKRGESRVLELQARCG